MEAAGIHAMMIVTATVAAVGTAITVKIWKKTADAAATCKEELWKRYACQAAMS